eukprot:9785641-Lingulodinium_polyedra.AAC.1
MDASGSCFPHQHKAAFELATEQWKKYQAQSFAATEQDIAQTIQRARGRKTEKDQLCAWKFCPWLPMD